MDRSRRSGRRTAGRKRVCDPRSAWGRARISNLGRRNSDWVHPCQWNGLTGVQVRYPLALFVAPVGTCRASAFPPSSSEPSPSLGTTAPTEKRNCPFDHHGDHRKATHLAEGQHTEHVRKHIPPGCRSAPSTGGSHKQGIRGRRMEDTHERDVLESMSRRLRQRSARLNVERTFREPAASSCIPLIGPIIALLRRLAGSLPAARWVREVGIQALRRRRAACP
jgi:hypothetical protein